MSGFRNEDENFGENEMGVGQRTDDDFEGEETCEDSRKEDSDKDRVITSNTFYCRMCFCYICGYLLYTW
jgi:hypothetical protein